MIVAVIFIIQLVGFLCIFSLLREVNVNATGIGIAAAGCLLAYALIENNDVSEMNKNES